MRDIEAELDRFIEEMREFGPQKTGLLQYFKNNYRKIMIMKDSGYTTKQIIEMINDKVARGQIVELRKPVSVVYFNKAWREFCIKKRIPTKPTVTMMQEIENEIFGYRDVIAKVKTSPETVTKAPNPTQETALQLAELIKFLLELLRQNTGMGGSAASKRLQGAFDEQPEVTSEQEAPRRPVIPANPQLSSVGKDRISRFFDDEET